MVLVHDREVDGTVGTSGFTVWIDPRHWGGRRLRNVIFGGVLASSSGSLTATLQLYNLDDGEAVTGTTLNTSSTDPVIVESSPLVVLRASGSIKRARRRYEVRITTTGTTAPEFAKLGQAFLRFL